MRASDVQKMIEAAVERALEAKKRSRKRRWRRSPSTDSSSSDNDDTPSTSSVKYVRRDDVPELLGHIMHNLDFDPFPGQDEDFLFPLVHQGSYNLYAFTSKD